MAPILIVDDLRADRLLTQRILQACKILNPVHLLETGRECISYFEGRGPLQPAEPAILFLDLLMRPTSGIEVLRALQGNPLAKRSLLVMLSGLTDIKHINEGYQLGAHTFLIKPLKRDDVLTLITAMENHIGAENTPQGYILHLQQESGTSLMRRRDLANSFSESLSYPAN